MARCKAPEIPGSEETQPFDVAQGHELVEWQMAIFHRPAKARENRHEERSRKSAGHFPAPHT
jgi:hypothetical protein